jgi:hypothetical protein
MWGGYYAIDGKRISKFTRKEDLLGLSTYLEFEESDLTNPEYKDCLDKVKFIYDNSKCWKKLNVWEEAANYFKMEINKCVRYEDFLVNHTQKLAIDLTDYFNQSRVLTQKGGNYAIDPIPVLTETGGGTQMAFFDGIADETTEHLAGGWYGDLLQIVDKLADGYSLINCCFAELQSKLSYCYSMFGVNKDGFLLKNDQEGLFKAVKLNLYGKRGPISRFKVQEKEKTIEFIPVA